MGRSMARPIAIALCFVLPLIAHAQVTVYRCTDSFGAVTLQNGTPCPKGSKQEKRTVEPAQSVATPAPVTLLPVTPQPPSAPQTQAQAPTQTRATPDPLPAATLPESERLPPPPLYQCNTVDQDSYLSDVPDPPQRCVRLNTTGLDGNASNGAGEACAMVSDQCQRIPDGQACDAWKRRVREAEAAWKFARADSAEKNKAEYERIARVAVETTCGQ